MRRDTDLEATLVAKYVVMEPLLNERMRRFWAAAESIAIGFGGDAIVSSATGSTRLHWYSPFNAQSWRVVRQLFRHTTMGHLGRMDYDRGTSERGACFVARRIVFNRAAKLHCRGRGLWQSRVRRGVVGQRVTGVFQRQLRRGT